MRSLIHKYGIMLPILPAPLSLGASPASTATPVPQSPLIGGFVQRADSEYGYSMLVPSDWDTADLGDARGYYPANSDSQTNRVLMYVSDLEVAATGNEYRGSGAIRPERIAR